MSSSSFGRCVGHQLGDDAYIDMLFMELGKLLARGGAIKVYEALRETSSLYRSNIKSLDEPRPGQRVWRL